VPAGELSCRRGRAAHDDGNLAEGHGEHVVQHEREPFRGIKGIEDHQQRRTDSVGQQRFFLGSTPPRASELLCHVHALRFLASRPTRLQHVPGHPCHDRGQPAAEVADAGGVRAAQPRPGFLHGVIGVAR